MAGGILFVAISQRKERETYEFFGRTESDEKRYPNETPVLGRLLVLGPEEGNRRHAHKG